MNSSKKLYTDPKISPASHTMSVDWYVWFRFFDVQQNRWVQKRYKAGINEFKTLKDRLPEANALKKVLAEELDAGWNPLQSDRLITVHIYSLQQALEYILNIKNQTLRKKSQQTYRHICKLFTDWATGKNLLPRGLKLFTAAHAQEYMDFLLTSKGYSGRTFNDHLIILRTFFNAFIEREWISKNPFRSVKRKPATIGRNHAYSDTEKATLEQYLQAHDPRLYYLTQFMYYSFIRRTEMTYIKVKHIDLLNKTITIPGESAKNNSQESVVIPVGLEPIIKAMELFRYSPEDFIFGRGLRTGPRKYGNPNALSTRHNEIVKRLGLDPEKGLYSWKHTGVCRAYYATNKDVYAIMRQLRHRDFNTTQIYLKSLGLVQNDVFRNAMIA